MLIKKVS